MMEIIEMDQWSSSADNVRELQFDSFRPADLKGGDSEAAKVIFGGSFTFKSVKETDSPRIGNVWFIKDDVTGKLKFYKARYDSSD